MFVTPAFAQGSPLGLGGDNMLVSLLPFVLIFVIMYFLILRPQQQKQRQHKEMVGNLRRGDTIVTTGGLVGGLIGLGIPEIEAKRYEQKLRAGNYLIAVDARDSDQVDRAKEIFKSAGAEDISTSSLSKAPRGDGSTRGSETRVTERSAH